MSDAQANFNSDVQVAQSGVQSGVAAAGSGVQSVSPQTMQSAGVASSAVSAYIQCINFPFPPIVFQYNPKAWTEEVGVNWKVSPQPKGKSTTPQYQGAQPRTLTVELILDAFAVPPLPPSPTIALLKSLTQPLPVTKSVPKVIFGWGANIVMAKAYVTKLSFAHERFLLGMPVRTKVTIGLTEEPPPDPLPSQNPTSGGLATRRTRTLVEGDTLASISYQEYGDPNYWRALAVANGIDDPMSVKSGTVLVVPEKADALAVMGDIS